MRRFIVSYQIGNVLLIVASRALIPQSILKAWDDVYKLIENLLVASLTANS